MNEALPSPHLQLFAAMYPRAFFSANLDDKVFANDTSVDTIVQICRLTLVCTVGNLSVNIVPGDHALLGLSGHLSQSFDVSIVQRSIANTIDAVLKEPNTPKFHTYFLEASKPNELLINQRCFVQNKGAANYAFMFVGGDDVVKPILLQIRQVHPHLTWQQFSDQHYSSKILKAVQTALESFSMRVMAKVTNASKSLRVLQVQPHYTSSFKHKTFHVFEAKKALKARSGFPKSVVVLHKNEPYLSRVAVVSTDIANNLPPFASESECRTPALAATAASLSRVRALTTHDAADFGDEPSALPTTCDATMADLHLPIASSRDVQWFHPAFAIHPRRNAARFTDADVTRYRNARNQVAVPRDGALHAALCTEHFDTLLQAVKRNPEAFQSLNASQSHTLVPAELLIECALIDADDHAH